MILHALVSIAENAIIDSEKLAGFDGESRFFAGLADGGLAHQFADFQNASGDRPLA